MPQTRSPANCNLSPARAQIWVSRNHQVQEGSADRFFKAYALAEFQGPVLARFGRRVWYGQTGARFGFRSAEI